MNRPLFVDRDAAGAERARLRNETLQWMIASAFPPEYTKCWERLDAVDAAIQDWRINEMARGTHPTVAFDALLKTALDALLSTAASGGIDTGYAIQRLRDVAGRYVGAKAITGRVAGVQGGSA